MKKKTKWKKIARSCIAVLGVICLVYLVQCYGVHGKESFVPEYEKVMLSETTDYETVFLQTGLGRAAVERLLSEGEFYKVLEAQENFFIPRQVSCVSLIGWFTKEDKLELGQQVSLTSGTVRDSAEYPAFLDLQPGDILLTISTHSVGWRHGHVALVLDENTTVESVMWGTDSTYGSIEGWKDYSNWAVLRVKDVTPELQQQVADYGREVLYGVPYHLSAGFIGNKAPRPEERQFGVHCSYLAWYAWNHFGYDLDSNGGRLVTAEDLLHSEYLEVVQLYGMDPREFLD
ncbi:MAG: hypothetical protein IJX66_03640 [Lachnospiraceae bacterium]|nr:hypothetical protein [Lachnospiraceae bacterium]